MGYLFEAGSADEIDIGTGVANWTTKVSVFVRFKVTAANSTARQLLAWVSDGVSFDWQLFLEFNASGTNQIQFGYRNTTPAYIIPVWTTGFAAGSEHVIVGVIDTTLGSANVKIYADTDATAKASANSTLGPITAVTPHVMLGAHPHVATQAADSTLYEVALWIGTALTGAESAQLAAGNPHGIARPSHYWPLISHAKDQFGGKPGTVSGAEVVAHSGKNLYAAALLPLLAGSDVGRAA